MGVKEEEEEGEVEALAQGSNNIGKVQEDHNLLEDEEGEPGLRRMKGQEEVVDGWLVEGK